MSSGFEFESFMLAISDYVWLTLLSDLEKLPPKAHLPDISAALIIGRNVGFWDLKTHLSRAPFACYFTLSTLTFSLCAFILYSALQSLELCTASSLIQYTLLWHTSLPHLPRDTIFGWSSVLEPTRLNDCYALETRPFFIQIASSVFLPDSLPVSRE
jgi:hypothetical protein